MYGHFGSYYHLFFVKTDTSSPGADSENLDFVAPPEEHSFIFCFFGSPAPILKT